jgi:hypothetical protein
MTQVTRPFPAAFQSYKPFQKKEVVVQSSPRPPIGIPGELFRAVRGAFRIGVEETSWPLCGKGGGAVVSPVESQEKFQEKLEEQT